MTPGAEQLRDIHGLDPMSWWPPALGWWLVMLVVVLLAVGSRYAWRWWRRRAGLDWRGDALRQLQVLRGRLEWGDARGVASDLSELMRRIAIAREGRRACAGLVDQDWLAWLEMHDPHHFSWTKDGRLLVHLPYAPPRSRRAARELAPLVVAAEEWIKVKDEADVKRSWWARLSTSRNRGRGPEPAGVVEGAHV